MITKYYSEKTDKFYNTAKECSDAEKIYDREHEKELKEQQKINEDYEKLEQLAKEYKTAYSKYINALKDFYRNHPETSLSLVLASDMFDIFSI